MLVDQMINLPQDAVLPTVIGILDRDFPDLPPKARAAALELAQSALQDMAGNIYHSPEHVLHVAVATRILCIDSILSISKHDEFLLFLAAIGHDFGWALEIDAADGFYLERRAAGRTLEILGRYGFDGRDLALVERLILATCPNSRREVMMLADAAEWGCLDLLREKGVVSEELRSLFARDVDAIMAGIMSDADLFFSVALGDDAYVEMTSRVSKEQAVLLDLPFKGIDPGKERLFFQLICRDGFASHAGTQFADSLEKLWQRSVGTPLHVRSHNLSKRLRSRPAEERAATREFLFSRMGGWKGYRAALRLETRGHVVVMAEDRRAAVVTRSGLCLSGLVEEAGIKIDRLNIPKEGSR
jgi:hypothetical protein